MLTFLISASSETFQCDGFGSSHSLFLRGSSLVVAKALQQTRSGGQTRRGAFFTSLLS